jgi:phosphatidate phosphatase APP1
MQENSYRAGPQNCLHSVATTYREIILGNLARFFGQIAMVFMRECWSGLVLPAVARQTHQELTTDSKKLTNHSPDFRLTHQRLTTRPTTESTRKKYW